MTAAMLLELSRVFEHDAMKVTDEGELVRLLGIGDELREAACRQIDTLEANGVRVPDLGHELHLLVAPF